MTDEDKVLKALRDVLTGEDKTPEPYVDLNAHVGEKTLVFLAVRGVMIDPRTKALSFEDRDGTLYFVPNVDWWSTDVVSTLVDRW